MFSTQALQELYRYLFSINIITVIKQVHFQQKFLTIEYGSGTNIDDTFADPVFKSMYVGNINTQ